MSIAADITFRSRVLSVYTGKQGCMCGCKGRYRYTALTRAEAGARRGYEVSDDEINEGVVSRVINKVCSSENVEVADGLGDEQLYIVDDPETGRRVAIYAIRAQS